MLLPEYLYKLKAVFLHETTERDVKGMVRRKASVACMGWVNKEEWLEICQRPIFLNGLESTYGKIS